MIIMKKERKCIPKKEEEEEEQKSKQSLYIWLGFRLQRLFFFLNVSYLTGPSKGHEKETSLRDSI